MVSFPESIHLFYPPFINSQTQTPSYAKIAARVALLSTALFFGLTTLAPTLPIPLITGVTSCLLFLFERIIASKAIEALKPPEVPEEQDAIFTFFKTKELPNNFIVPKDLRTNENSMVETLLHCNPAWIEELVNKYGVNPNTKDANGNTVMMRVVTDEGKFWKRSYDMIKKLLEVGADSTTIPGLLKQRIDESRPEDGQKQLKKALQLFQKK